VDYKIIMLSYHARSQKDCGRRIGGAESGEGRNLQIIGNGEDNQEVGLIVLI
jgi:hypothetical protein